ncbi:hypothetical protein [Dactylosporangium salmoneum]|uniref:Lipoprotein LpqB beta-propeller domain-containing protein n=1 Tax=Dactylosporangium salmoneum TaxID=53361 RepID=A0ABN3HW10_9ACTN
MTPDDLVRTLHRAADTVPPSAPDLQAVLRRHHRRRLRSVATAATVAVAVTASGMVLAERALSSHPAPPATPPATTAAPPTPAATETAAASGQRLPLEPGWAMLDAGSNQNPLGYQPPRGLLEFSPDRKIVAVALPDLIDGPRQRVALDDGRTVLLGSKDLQPGVQRQDGVNVTGLAIRLVVLAPGGAVALTREVRVQGQDVELVGATATAAYLYRTPGQIVRHDLASGKEERLTALDPLPGWDVNNLSIQSGLLLTTSQTACDLRISSADTGKPIRTVHFDVSQWRCPTADRVRVSADGRLLAIALRGTAANPVNAFDVVNVATGVTTHRLLSSTSRSGIVGMAWRGTVLRVAWVNLPNPGSQVYPMADVLQTADVA